VNPDLIHRLEKRAEIRRQISTRKSVQEGKPDRLADLLDEAAAALRECTRGVAERDELVAAIISACDHIEADRNPGDAIDALRGLLRKIGAV
jgi:hypothetical protein